MTAITAFTAMRSVRIMRYLTAKTAFSLGMRFAVAVSGLICGGFYG